ncbi:orotidine-5'-phosphate decarboxylase [soil metagenome]
MTALYAALDVDNAEDAVRLANLLATVVDGFKVGLELLLGPGPATIGAIRQLGRPVFADAKLLDIPHTVEGAARQLGRLGARYVTVHASGGAAMLEAARIGLEDGAAGNPAGILAVTVLTSLDDGALAKIGVSGTTAKQVARLARLAAAAGTEGVVCSVKELDVVHQVAPALVRVTPGIRFADDTDDQLRVAAPAAAAAKGADIIVVGRPIIRAKNPVAAARRFSEAIGTPTGS